MFHETWQLRDGLKFVFDLHKITNNKEYFKGTVKVISSDLNAKMAIPDSQTSAKIVLRKMRG